MPIDGPPNPSLFDFLCFDPCLKSIEHKIITEAKVIPARDPNSVRCQTSEETDWNTFQHTSDSIRLRVLFKLRFIFHDLFKTSFTAYLLYRGRWLFAAAALDKASLKNAELHKI